MVPDSESHSDASAATPVPPDRINELYYGTIQSKETAQIGRDRIHWMCSQSRGTEVLDVGCSQGIVSILLAREGFSVAAIDPHPDAIAYARKEIERETDEVRARIDLVKTDLTAFKTNKKFDTIFLGEIIEHQTRPRQMIEQAVALLSPNGRVVLTTPFGLHPHPDHKISLFPRDLAELVHDLMTFECFEVVDRYMRCVMVSNAGTSRRGQISGASLKTLLQMTETGASESQRYLNSRLDDRVNRLGTANAALNQVRKQIVELEKSQSSLKSSLAIEAERRIQLKTRLESAEKTLERANIELVRSNKQTEDLEKSRDALTKSLAIESEKRAQFQTALKSSEETLQHANAALAQSREQAATHAEQNARLEKILSELRGALQEQQATETALRHHLRETEIAFEEASDRAKKEQDELRVDLVGVRHGIVAMEQRVHAIRKSIPYRLGEILINAPQSWHNLVRTPGLLLSLRANAKRVRQTQDGGLRNERSFEDEVFEVYAKQGHQAAARVIMERGERGKQASLLLQLATLIVDADPLQACDLGRQAYQKALSPNFAKALAFLTYDCGFVREPAALVEALPSDLKLRPSGRNKIEQIKGAARIYRQPLEIPAPGKPSYEPIAQTVLYVTSMALPFHIAGYATRTQCLAEAIVANGWSVTCVTRPGYPGDRADRLMDAHRSSHSFGNVTYTHVQGASMAKQGIDAYVRSAAQALEPVIRRLRPAVIHAASNYANALPALIVARKLGIPFVYEVRGLWEYTAASRSIGWEKTERFELSKMLETQVAKNADVVLTLTDALADELKKRGIERTKILLAPNSVDTDAFAPLPKDADLLSKLGLSQSDFIVVYIGSLLRYEGLDDLIRALGIVIANGVNAHLVIVGDGEARESLAQLSMALAIGPHVKLVGRVPYEIVRRYWSLADAVAFPRKSYPVCELVSPLKPLEPMAMAIPTIVSDVAPLREIANEGRSALIHPAGAVDALAECLQRLARDRDLCRSLGQAGRDFAMTERTWQTTAGLVVDVYSKLTTGGIKERKSPTQEGTAAQAPRPALPKIVAIPPKRNSMSEAEKATFVERLGEAYAIGGAAAVRAYAERQARGHSPVFRAYCLLNAGKCCQLHADSSGLLDLAQAAKQVDRSASTLRGVARAFYAAGNVVAAASVVDELEEAQKPLTERDLKLATEVRGHLAMYRAATETVAQAPIVAPVAGRSLYVLHNSLPYSSAGYATRSHGIGRGVVAAGYDIRPYTRPGFPYDVNPDLEGVMLPSESTIDELTYRRLFENRRKGQAEYNYALACADIIEKVLRDERPAVVHAASNYLTGLPALVAAKRVGLPFIYEVRGFWEITRSSREEDFRTTTRFSLMRQYETLIAKQADAVITLTGAMKEELVARGVDPDKIVIADNAVDPERFQPMKRDETLAEQLGLSSAVPVIGYVGSFVHYEGLDDLIIACGKIASDGVDFRLLLVGDGAIVEQLRGLIEEHCIADRTILTGRVPYEQVEAHYSLIDICPFPRKSWEVCEKVSPLKPFEALAMGKAVVVSSVRALTEIIEDGQNGLIFDKGNVTSLAEVLTRCLKDPHLGRRLGSVGRQWVVEHRTWQRSGRIVAEVYNRVLAQQ